MSALASDQSNHSVSLVEQEELIVRPEAEAEVGAVRRISSLRRAFLTDDLEERLRRAAVVEQHASDRALATGGEAVGVDVEDLSRREVGPDHQIRELRDGRSAV